jgi:5,10-methylenetetrahydrofolate reductase
LEKGQDLAGKKLKGSPRFCLGAAVDPGAASLDQEIEKMERKVFSGAEFFQTQPVYELDAFANFMKRVRRLNRPVLAGIFLLKSAKMGRFINQNVPGVHIPESILDEMEKSSDPVAKSIEIAVRTIKGVREFTQGAHIMTINWEDKVPRVLDALPR